MAIALFGSLNLAYAQTKASTTTTLALTSGGLPVTSVTPGTVIALTATVTAGTSPVTAGQVNFCNAAASYCTDIERLGTAAVTSNGTSTYKFVPGPGTHRYKAEYVLGSLGAPSTSPPAFLTVGPAPALVYSDTVSISSNSIPGDYSLTATVVGIGGPAAPTGDVSFIDTSYSNTLLATAQLGSSTAGLGWEISQTPALSSDPIFEVAGDFNGDGIPDLALLWTNNNTSEVTVFLGKGDGTFSSQTTTQAAVTGQTYSAMVAGDFNGDGKLDLALLCNACGLTTNGVTTFLGNGDGTFTVSQTSPFVEPSTSGGDFIPGSVVAADFNGDGKLDLAVVGDYYTSGGVAILLGNGDGTFTAAGPNLNPSAGYGSIATGDFNGDGIPDLVATNYFGATNATVFLGNGDGTFTAVATLLTVDSNPDGFVNSVAVGDFNGDGVLDLAFSDDYGVEVFGGNGDGTFNGSSTNPIAVPGNALHSLITGDFNNDGKVDLAGVDSYNGLIAVLVGAGDGSFQVISTTPAINFVSPTGGQIVTAEFNGVGVSDVALLPPYANMASILLTEPTQTATATVNGIAPVGAGTHNVEASYAGDSNYPAIISSTVQLAAALAPLILTPASGTYSTAQTITITEAIPGATIYYSAFGPLSTNGFVQYSSPILFTEGGTETISAYATETGYGQTNNVELTYVIDLPAAPAPTFSPTPGIFAGSQQVTISDTANNATIYYTTDGTIPSIYSAVYSGANSVTNSETLAAIAIAPGYSVSAPTVASYLNGSADARFIYTVAGNQAYGYSGDGGPATIADLNRPEATAMDSAGNLYISDSNNNVARMVAAGTGIITTVAGNATAGYSGDGSPATSAELNYPGPIVIDAAGDLYIADLNNAAIRRVDASTKTITTLARNVSYPGAIAIDGSGNLYLAEPESSAIQEIATSTGAITTVAGTGASGYTGDGGPALGATLHSPTGVAVDSSGNIYIADEDNNVIREVNSSTKNISTVAGNGTRGFSGDGGPATSAELDFPSSVAVDAGGNLYIADYDNNRIREVNAATKVITTIAGDANGPYCNSLGEDGGPATSAGLCYPSNLSLDAGGDVFAIDFYSRVREITSPTLPPTTATATPTFSLAPGTYVGAQTVTVSDSTPGAEIYITIDGAAASATGQGYNSPINVTGNVSIGAIAAAPGFLPSAATSAAYTITTPPPTLIHTVAGSGIEGFSGVDGPALSAQFRSVADVAPDAAGNLYVSDPGNNVVWKVAASTGIISIAAGNGTPGNYGNGGPATSAELNQPEGVAVDSAGNLYIADSSDGGVREVDAQTGIITLFASGFGNPAHYAALSQPYGLAFDASGDLYISDLAKDLVFMVSGATGAVTTVAGNQTTSPLGDGGPATSAAIPSPWALAVDSAGNLYIATTATNYFASTTAGRVRKVAVGTGIISTVAGDGDYGGTGDGGPATSAEVNPVGLAVDASGNLYISNFPSAIRRVDALTGVITRFAGNGYTGSIGDGGSATIASLNSPVGIAFDASGNLYIADQSNYKVREVTFPGPTATPTFNPPAGTYTGTLSVQLTDATANATIYYTTDGSTPTTGSTKYTGAISVSESETVNAIAVASGYAESVVATAAYGINQPATPTITWPTPAPITYGTSLSSSQLDATASVPGTFVYSPAAGTVPKAGSQTLTATFTPTDTTDYSTATAIITLVVNPATPTITWATPMAVTFGTALGSTQLDATASAPGTFAYSPPAGTVPAVGSDPLSVTFTPTDTTDYTQATATVTLVVSPVPANPAPGINSLSPAVVNAGGAAFTLTVNGSGFVTSSTVYWGSAALATQYVGATQLTAQVPATQISATGTYAITVQTASPGGGTSNSFQFDVDTAGATAPDFTTLSATVTPGSSATYPVTLPSSANSVFVTCLNLPSGAACSYSAASGTVTITTSPSTSAGTYQIVVVFTETLPGAATAMVFLPILLLPLLFIRRQSAARGFWFAANFVLLVSVAVVATGCGGGGGGSTTPPPQTHQVTSSAAVTLTVQ